MQYRPVGNTGVEVSALGIGTMRFKGRENAVGVVRRAIELGCTYIDCGAAYSFQSPEENAEALCVQTKGEAVAADYHGTEPRVPAPGPVPHGAVGRPGAQPKAAKPTETTKSAPDDWTKPGGP